MSHELGLPKRREFRLELAESRRIVPEWTSTRTLGHRRGSWGARTGRPPRGPPPIGGPQGNPPPPPPRRACPPGVPPPLAAPRLTPPPDPLKRATPQGTPPHWWPQRGGTDLTTPPSLVA